MVGPVISIAGLHGTGKTTTAQILAKSLGLRHVSAGYLFRETARERGVSLSELSLEASGKDELDRLVDDRTKKEAGKGEVVLDGLLSAWMAGEDADLKFFLFASDNVRLSRIAGRDRCSLSEAKEATLMREELERGRFKRFYGVDIDDHSIYDLLLNTGLLSPEGNAQVLESFVRAYLKEHKGEDVKCQQSISDRSVLRPRDTKKGRSAS